MQLHIAPGLGLPLRWQQDNDDDQAWHQHSQNSFLPSALDGSEDHGRAPEPLSVPERRMLSLMGGLTDTFAWREMIFDRGFIRQWKSEQLAQQGVSRNMVDWCLKEVQQYARGCATSMFIPALERGIYKSDDCMSQTQREQTYQAISRLERHLRNRGCLLPSPDGVTKFVDPSLFPFSFERSKCLKEGRVGWKDSIQQCGRGQIIGKPTGSEGALKGRGCYSNDTAWSLRYQWLPFDIHYDGDTSSIIIASYINNVHPVRSREIYGTLHTLLNQLLPLIDKTPSILATPSRFWAPCIDVERSDNDDIPNREPEDYQPQEARTRPVYLRSHKTRYERPLALRNHFRDNGCQVVLDVSRISLTPESPTRPSTDWHVQGQLNERICATFLYCYSYSNIHESSISFRHRVSNDELMELNTLSTATADTEEIYGIKDGGSCVQDLGDVAIRENRVISFPNTVQVRFNELRLQDPSCGGHVELLTIHLIDPCRPIISTNMVPTQRRDWWADELRETVEVFKGLPPEVFDMILDAVHPFPISLDDAEVMRDQMMEERKEFQRKQTEAMMRPRFNLMTEARRSEEEWAIIYSHYEVQA